MVLDKSATDDQLLDALRDEMSRLKAQLQQAHQVQAQLQAAAASGTRCECCDTPCLFWLVFFFFLALLHTTHQARFCNCDFFLFIVLFYTFC
jgi:hypothetical protein